MPWPENPRYLGKPVPRLDGPAKVTGRARYISDLAPAGVLYGAILRSRWAAASITAIRLDRARAARGIRAAILVCDLPYQTRYYGDELAAIAGESRQAVEDALALIEVTAQPLPHVVHEVEAAKPAAPRVFAESPNMGKDVVRQTGDVDAAFAAAATVVEGTFTTPVLIHHPMESYGGVVSWTDEGVTAWISTQGISSVRNALVRQLKLPQTAVRVICDHMGGGFGAKTSPGAEPAICARLSKEAGAPVRLMITREEASLAAGNRPSSVQRLKLAADANGKLVAFEMHGFGAAGYATGASTGGGSASANIPMPYIYPVPNTRVVQATVAINAGQSRPMRAPGHPVSSYGMESIMDELAVKMGIDPVEFRLKNDPFPIRQREYALGAERFGWKEKYRPPGSSPGPIKVGVGCAGATWGGGGRGTQAQVQINPDGTVEVRCGTQDIGTGTRTLAAMIVADLFHLDLAKVNARVGDTQFPPSGTSGGSTQTASVAPAVYDACEKAIAELKQASGIDQPVGARWLEACRALGGQPLVVQGRWREGLSSSGVGGVQFAEVEVDTDTGLVRVRKILCVQDCGLIVNRLTCESQVNGGIIMGLGFALSEERVMDRHSGVLLNPGLEGYKVPGPADMPDIEVLLLDMPERGPVGVGEPVTIPTAAAIANAVANALGVRVPSLPLTPAHVLAALGRVPAAAGAVSSRSKDLDTAFAALAAAPASRPILPQEVIV